MRAKRVGAILIGASGGVAWLLACATLPVTPIDRTEDDGATEAAADAADAAAHDAATLDARLEDDADADADADASEDDADADAG
jgi:hypothetical protein